MSLVSVICLNFNQSAYVDECLDSVLVQGYAPIELLIVDDGSHDDSVRLIETWIRSRCELPSFKRLASVVFWPLPTNVGNCAAFNHAFRQSKGDYVIDLAADDVLENDRIAKQVARFDALPPDVGVVFSDALLIDAQSRVIGRHYKRNNRGILRQPVPTGDVYRATIARYYICTPTMMMRRTVLERLNGYDESLSYEDYDFWVRSARVFKYAYLDECLTRKRVLPQSHSKGFYFRKRNAHLASTLRVCHKAAALNRDAGDDAALAVSVRYHLRLSLFTENFDLAIGFFQLLCQLKQNRWPDACWHWLAQKKVRLGGFYGLYLHFRGRSK